MWLALLSEFGWGHLQTDTLHNEHSVGATGARTEIWRVSCILISAFLAKCCNLVVSIWVDLC